MEYIIIALWVAGAWSEAVSLSYSNSTYGQGDFNFLDVFFVFFWPAASVVVALLAFSQAFANGPWNNQ